MLFYLTILAILLWPNQGGDSSMSNLQGGQQTFLVTLYKCFGNQKECCHWSVQIFSRKYLIKIHEEITWICRSSKSYRRRGKGCNWVMLTVNKRAWFSKLGLLKMQAVYLTTRNVAKGNLCISWSQWGCHRGSSWVAMKLYLSLFLALPNADSTDNIFIILPSLHPFNAPPSLSKIWTSLSLFLKPQNVLTQARKDNKG